MEANLHRTVTDPAKDRSVNGRRTSVRKDYLPFGRPNFSSREIAAAVRVLKSGWIGMGAEVVTFEQELAEFTGAAQVVTVNSCTSALFVAMKLLGVGSGDEVIVPSLTWCSTANVALYVGARPVFCDVDPATLCVTEQTILAAVTRRTRAVIVVHYGGRAVDVAAIRRALPPRVELVEDAAHAFGARYPSGRPVGSSGNIVCFSFYANKNLSTGEGGALAVPNDRLADRARSLRQNGFSADAWKRFSHPRVTFLDGAVSELGYKMNYTDLQAAIGRIQLSRQAELSRRRLRVATVYERLLRRFCPGYEPIAGQTDVGHARHLYVIKQAADARRCRDDVFVALRSLNVGVSLHYAPLHLMSFYREYAPVPLRHTEAVATRIMTLPMSASIKLKDAEYVIATLRDSI